MQKFNVYTIVVRKVIDLKEGHFEVEFEYESIRKDGLKDRNMSLRGRIEDFMEMLGMRHIEKYPKKVNIIERPIRCKLVTYEHGTYRLIFAITDLENEKSYLIDYGMCCNREFFGVAFKYVLMQELFNKLEQVSSTRMDSSNLRIQNLRSEILNLEERIK